MDSNDNEQSVNLIDLSTTVDKISELILDMAKNNRPVLGGEHYISDAELSAKLKISRRTLQNWRANGAISYIMLGGGKVLYRESDIQTFLDSSYIKAFSAIV